MGSWGQTSVPRSVCGWRRAGGERASAHAHMHPPCGTMKVPAPYCSIRISFCCGRMLCLRVGGGGGAALVSSAGVALPPRCRTCPADWQPVRPARPACQAKFEHRNPSSLEGVELPEHCGGGDEHVCAAGHAALRGGLLVAQDPAGGRARGGRRQSGSVVCQAAPGGRRQRWQCCCVSAGARSHSQWQSGNTTRGAAATLSVP